MALKDRFQRRSKDTRYIVGGLVALLVALTAVYTLFQRGRDLPETLLTNQVLLFALWYVNVVLILAILFVLFRNAVKLVVERRHRILGSRFKTKLVLTYVGLSLVPVILVFAYATELFQSTVDRWINTPLAELFGQSGTVVQGFYQRIEGEAATAAGEARLAIADLDPRDPAQRLELNGRLQSLLGDLSLDYLAIYDGPEFLHGLVTPQTGMDDLPEPGRSFLASVVEEGAGRRRIDAPGHGGRLVLAAVRLDPPEQAGPPDPRGPPEGSPVEAPDPGPVDAAGTADPPEASEPSESADGAPPPVVVAGLLVAPELAEATEALIQAQQGHLQLVVQREAIKTSHLLLFLLVTLVILLATSWVGLYLTRRITVPIQALAAGTERIGRGEFSHRVDVEADDELGILVGSFNRMSAELERSRDLIESRTRELVETNTRLAEERALATAVIDSVAAGVIATDPEGRILTCNNTALAMLREAAGQDIEGLPITEVWNDPERTQLARLLATRVAPPPEAAGPGPGQPVSQPVARPVSQEVRLVLGGEWKTFEVKVTPIRTASGEVRGRVMVLEDLSELIRAQQMAAWTEAARRIAHEIKNPLTPIKLASERILQKHRRGDEDLGEALETGIEVLLREVEAMQTMVDEFSRYARMPRPQPVAVDLPALLEETVQLYRGIKQGVAVEARVDGDLGELRLDPEQIKRALINLLDNAVEATEAPGTVTVRAAMVPAGDRGPNDPGPEGEGEAHLEIQVADTGRGVDPQDQDKLFLPYFSTKGRGTGLGLAIVQRIIADHRGTIRVEANRPRGTVFVLELPVR